MFFLYTDGKCIRGIHLILALRDPKGRARFRQKLRNDVRVWVRFSHVSWTSLLDNSMQSISLWFLLCNFLWGGSSKANSSQQTTCSSLNLHQVGLGHKKQNACLVWVGLGYYSLGSVLDRNMQRNNMIGIYWNHKGKHIDLCLTWHRGIQQLL